MEEFIDWYCSEPRLALNRGVVLRYRLQLEDKKLAASTISVRLAAVRRLAYEAADAGLLSPELVAGIRRVKGAPQLGRRVGNWLTSAEGETLLTALESGTLRQKKETWRLFHSCSVVITAIGSGSAQSWRHSTARRSLGNH